MGCIIGLSMSARNSANEPKNLQIIRTRNPPNILLEQIALLQTEAGYSAISSEIRTRLDALPRNDRLLLAVDGEKLLGIAHLRVTSDLINQDTAEVVMIIVRQSHRRRNIGRRLINAAETWARESGHARLLLRTEVVRTAAHAFFVALGYEETSTTLEFIREL
jgi:GNAT superfamily N-acetyltransferase